MVKVHKMFCISSELLPYLESKGHRMQSEFIEKLIREAKDREDDPFLGMTEEQKKIEEQKILILREAHAKIKEVDNGKGINWRITAE